jgi:hypothetical protein
MIERLAEKGIALRTTLVDGWPELLAFAASGRIGDSERLALHRSRRLLAAHVAGIRADCEAPDCSEPAVDVTWPAELLVCSRHTEPEAWR